MTAAFSLRQATLADAKHCHHIEVIAYQGDEAASLERITTRIAHYPQGFLVLEVDGVIAGFINSGCAREVVMSDDDFKQLIGHDPDAANVVIMSVAVDPAFQGRGLARMLMQHFIAQMRAAGKHSIHLMCKQHHVAMYEKMGYSYIRPSASDHGGKSWHEMVQLLIPPEHGAHA